MLTTERPHVPTTALMALAYKHAWKDAREEAINEDAFLDTLRTFVALRARDEASAPTVEVATLTLVTTYYGVAARALQRGYRRGMQLPLLEGAP